MKKLICVLLTLALVFGILAGCTPNAEKTTEQGNTETQRQIEQGSEDSKDGQSEDETPKKGGILKVGLQTDLTTGLYTGLVSPEDSIHVMFLYESLMREDANGEIQPYLLEKLESDPEALTYTLTLKQGIKLQDGSDLNADSCAFSLQLYKDKGRKSQSFFGNIESIEKTGDYEVTIHLSQWDSTIPRSLARDCGFQTSKEAYEKYGEDYMKEHPIGTGPFIMTNWERDSVKTFVKFDEYWRGEPLLDGVEIHIYADSMVAQAALDTGDIQAYYSMDYSMSKTFEESGYYVSRGLPISMPMLCFNSVNENDPLFDVRVRRALSYAIDAALIDETLYYGYMETTNQFAPKSSVYYNDEVVGYDYNVEKAKELLAEAGYPNGFKTVLHGKNEPVIVEDLAAIQQMLAAVGVDATIDIIEAGDYGTALCGWDEGLFLHATGLPTAIINQANSMFRQGLSGVVLGLTSILRPDDLDKALDKAATAYSEEDARKYMKEAQRLMIDEYCLFKPIGVGVYTMVVSPTLHDHHWGEITYMQADLHLAWLDK